MYSKQNRFFSASNGQDANHYFGRQQVVYDDDLFGENIVAANEIAKEYVMPPSQVRVDKPIALVEPMPAKRYVRQQPFHPYQRTNNSVVLSKRLTNRAPASATDNEYKLGEKIGHGTYGEVFKGIIVQTNQPVAIKRLLGKIKSVIFRITPSQLSINLIFSYRNNSGRLFLVKSRCCDW